jgi:hypothetical protein
LKKRSKKLLPFGARLSGSVRKGIKVFWFFFSKKNILLLELGGARSHAPRAAYFVAGKLK